MNIDLHENEKAYWKFIFENKINNIILIEDKSNEAIVKYIIKLN